MSVGEERDTFEDAIMSSLISRNITVNGRRTSVRLEPEMWDALREISQREGCRTHDICSLVALRKRKTTSLTAAIRVFLMLYYRVAATEEGHKRAGHGCFNKMLQRARVQESVLFPPKEPPKENEEGREKKRRKRAAANG